MNTLSGHRGSHQPVPGRSILGHMASGRLSMWLEMSDSRDHACGEKHSSNTRYLPFSDILFMFQEKVE